VEARQARFAVLLRQSLASLGWQAVGHSGLIAFAGWLLAVGEITLGQFVAAEVIVGSLLLNLDTVVRRISHVFYLMTSVVELDDLFSQAKDVEPGRQCVPLPDPRDRGIHILCREVAFAHPDCAPVLEHFSIELRPGDKVGILARTSSEQNAIARVLAGVYRPTQGIVRYNSVDIWDLDPEDLHGVIGVVLNYHPSLFDGTLEDNISMGRSGVRYQDLHWALNLVELEEEIAALPLALRTPVSFESEAFTDSLMQRVLVARAVVTHPHVLLLEGSLPSIPQELRGRILRRLCANEESWTVVYVSCDPSFLIEAHARRVLAA
jgi:ABC-type multidrug transport system fused ATPase/permease subunit